MAGVSTSALSPGTSQALTIPSSATWASYTCSWTCSSATDTSANAWLQGSADGGTTWFPLTPAHGSNPPASPTATGVRFYSGQPVNSLKAFVQCASGNTVTVTVTGE